MKHQAIQAIRLALGIAGGRIEPLAGGSVSAVFRVDLDGEPCGFGAGPFVAKVGHGGAVEARMLEALRATDTVPVPEVFYQDDGLLIMQWVRGRCGVARSAGGDAGARLAALHAVRGPHFGWSEPTRLGSLDQPNPVYDTFAAFFAEGRLMPFGKQARAAGRIDAATLVSLENVCAKLPTLVDEPTHPALVHGDLWSGNVLTDGGALSALIDPAIHWGHPEVDLAFTTMFGGFDPAFYDAYGGTLDDGFWRERRHLWNLWPLLVHALLFGGGYAEQLAATARTIAGS